MSSFGRRTGISDSVLADLMDGMRGMMPCTPMRFFHPTQEFWDTMEQFRIADRIIIEFGAGKGDTATEAQERGFRWGGCDLHSEPSQIQQGIQCFNALRFPLIERMVVIACRPDHSGWVEPALLRALEVGCVAIYVSKPDNIERDLDSYNFANYTITDFDNVGEDGERMLIFTP